MLVHFEDFKKRWNLTDDCKWQCTLRNTKDYCIDLGYDSSTKLFYITLDYTDESLNEKDNRRSTAFDLDRQGVIDYVIRETERHAECYLKDEV